jgi:hypothetical protein
MGWFGLRLVRFWSVFCWEVTVRVVQFALLIAALGVSIGWAIVRPAWDSIGAAFTATAALAGAGIFEATRSRSGSHQSQRTGKNSIAVQAGRDAHVALRERNDDR